MADLLKDKLRPASFRGVAFQVDASSFETGRRTQIHEYPQRDKPYAQDMGRSTRRIEFEAFVIGADYIAQANRVLGAMETAGPGDLVHPWFGQSRVNGVGCRVSFDHGLGIAKFGLQFVESGELVFPSAANSTAVLSRSASSVLEAASVGRFAEVFNVLRTANSVSTSALSVYGKVFSFLSNPAFALASALGFASLPGNLSSVASLLTNSTDLGWTYAGWLNLSGKVKSGAIQQNDTTLGPAVHGLTHMATDAALAHSTATATTTTRRKIIANQNAIHANTRQLLLVQACGLASYLKCSIYDDTLAVKNQLAAAIDAEAQRVDDDDLYQALMAARSAMWRDLTERSRDSSRLVTLTPPTVLPMLAIAYDYYEDAGRDGEVSARNKIRNPGFVPVADLRVLSR